MDASVDHNGPFKLGPLKTRLILFTTLLATIHDCAKVVYLESMATQC